MYSKGHGSLSSSGIATPFLTDSSTPSSNTVGNSVIDARELEQNLEGVNEKLQRKQSFTKAKLTSEPPTRTESSGVVTKEHSEQGRVKKDVYVQYIEAASMIGFAMFIVATGGSQIVSVMANNTLRGWGEHNREAGGNKGVGLYLLQYGLLSLSSVLLSGAAAIIIWVFCSIRSARRLHDNVRSCLSAIYRSRSQLWILDVICRYESPNDFLRADSHWPVCRFHSFLCMATERGVTVS